MEIFVYKNGADSVERGINFKDLPALLADKTNVVWVDFEAIEPDDIKQAESILLKIFKFHYLTVEDCLETRNQPKVESFPDYIYFIMHGVKNETNSANFVTKELDGYLGDNLSSHFTMKLFAVSKTSNAKSARHLLPSSAVRRIFCIRFSTNSLTYICRSLTISM